MWRRPASGWGGWGDLGVAKIKVQQTEITVIQVKDEDYISLTDMLLNFS
jgi:hypothetical protein